MTTTPAAAETAATGVGLLWPSARCSSSASCRVERWLSKVALAQSGYGHVFIEHNRGHHVRVATPEGPASSYHLQRHSDHHAHPLRRFQALRHFDEAPELPSG